MFLEVLLRGIVYHPLPNRGVAPSLTTSTVALLRDLDIKRIACYGVAGIGARVGELINLNNKILVFADAVAVGFHGGTGHVGTPLSLYSSLSYDQACRIVAAFGMFE